MRGLRSSITTLILVSILLTDRVFADKDWLELRGDHFIIHYKSDDKFAKEVLKQAEEYYLQINEDLGYQRYSEFWQWDNRVKIYIHPDQAAFLAATGRNNWSHGFADYYAKAIHSYPWNEGFLESLLPHEITHLIFRDYVGFQGEVPVWLDEGVAQWEEPGKRAWARDGMKSFLEMGYMYSMDIFTTVDVRNVTLERAVQLFYAQAVSIIDFLVAKYGTENFVTFCRQLRDGKNLEEALKFTYPTTVRDLKELEEQWKEYVYQAT